MIVGLVLIGIGVVAFLWPVRDRPAPDEVQERDAERGTDFGKVLEELNKLIDKFDMRYRPGLILMIIGLALVALGVFVETQDSTDDDTSETSQLLVRVAG